MSSTSKTDPIIIEVHTIAARQVAEAKHHAACVTDANKLSAGLQFLAKHNPSALKEYVDRTKQRNAYIENGHIIGYGTPLEWPGYVEDFDLHKYIAGIASTKIDNCIKWTR